MKPTKINPKDYIHLIHERSTPITFAHALQEHLEYIGSDIKRFTYSLGDFNEAQKLSKYVDELSGEENDI